MHPLDSKLKFGDNGVHLLTPPEYLLVQQPFSSAQALHSVLDSHLDQSPLSLVSTLPVSGVEAAELPGEAAAVSSTMHSLLVWLNSGESGVHLLTPPEYFPEQHPFSSAQALHSMLVSHLDQSPLRSVLALPLSGVDAETSASVAATMQPLVVTLNPGERGVHLATPSEYFPEQHPVSSAHTRHSALESHVCQSGLRWSTMQSLDSMSNQGDRGVHCVTPSVYLPVQQPRPSAQT